MRKLMHYYNLFNMLVRLLTLLPKFFYSLSDIVNANLELVIYSKYLIMFPPFLYYKINL